VPISYLRPGCRVVRDAGANCAECHVAGNRLLPGLQGMTNRGCVIDARVCGGCAVCIVMFAVIVVPFAAGVLLPNLMLLGSIPVVCLHSGQ